MNILLAYVIGAHDQSVLKVERPDERLLEDLLVDLVDEDDVAPEVLDEGASLKNHHAASEATLELDASLRQEAKRKEVFYWRNSYPNATAFTQSSEFVQFRTI
jgi:hypothetical protein